MAIARKRGPQLRGYVQLPRTVLLNPDVSDGACRLYALLDHYARQRGECWPGYKRLAQDLGITTKTIKARMAELKTLGLVDVEQQGDGRSATIILQAAPFGDLRTDQEQTCEPDFSSHVSVTPDYLSPEESVERIAAIREWLRGDRKGKPPG